MPNQFSRTEILIGSDAVEKLKNARVAVFGIGGVGGHVVEALVRSGLGNIDIIDNDKVSLTNLNRQIIALHSTIGKSKVDAMEERIKDINPDVNVVKHEVFYAPQKKGRKFGGQEVRLFNDTDLTPYRLNVLTSNNINEISQQPQHDIPPSPQPSPSKGEGASLDSLSTAQPFNPSTDKDLLPYRPIALLPTNFDFSQYDYVVDAIDTVVGKLSLIEECKKANTPIICAMGAGNKLDPTKFEVADISKTSVCPLARVIRQELKKRKITKVKVVFSKEEPVKPEKSDEISQKHQIPGSNAFCPSVMGLIIASEVIKDLTK